MADIAAPAPTATLAAGDRAVVVGDIPESWVGPIAAGTTVTIVDLGPDALGPGEDYAAELADGRAVSFAASELAPEHCPVDGGTGHEHCPLHGWVEYVCCVPATPAALYVVVMDGYTAADATYSLSGRVSRDEAIRVCDDANMTAVSLGLVGRWHAERVA